MAAHISSNYLALEMEMKQFRRYEIKMGMSPAMSAEEIGIILASNNALHIILQTLSYMVQLLLLVPATTCSPERSF